MMRPHCDRCDGLCDEHPTWVEDDESKLDGLGKPMGGAGVNPIWHIEISADQEGMFCRACWISILEAHLGTLKAIKVNGGHLVDCRWSVAYRRYDCAEGCEIKRINEENVRRHVSNGTLYIPLGAEIKE